MARELWVIEHDGEPVAPTGDALNRTDRDEAVMLCDEYGEGEAVTRYVPVEVNLRAALATASAKLHGAAQALRLLVTDDAPPALRAVVQCLDDAHKSAELELGND